MYSIASLMIRRNPHLPTFVAKPLCNTLHSNQAKKCLTSRTRQQGCQIFLVTSYQHCKKYTKRPLNTYTKCPLNKQNWCKYTKWLTNLPNFSTPRPSKKIEIEIFGMKIHIPSGKPVESAALFEVYNTLNSNQ
jgi:hypothetical protein